MIFSFFNFSFADENCISSEGSPIIHQDFVARADGLKKRILVIGLIHGDEPESGVLSHLWVDRLNMIKSPSNHWRIIPLANPDGLKLKTRMNSRKVDLNRNFPTKDWDKLAIKFWKNSGKEDPRRFPGTSAGSEIEVKCIIEHVNGFKPDIIISIHTPYGLFDFDGPKFRPISNVLPWKRLGTFPGSLGRWAWDERKIPVLTIELDPETFLKSKSSFIMLQDKITDLLWPVR